MSMAVLHAALLLAAALLLMPASVLLLQVLLSFARGRADFVEALLGVSPLYRTETARAELESRARENLLRSWRTWRLA